MVLRPESVSVISIHVPRERDDGHGLASGERQCYFNPRPS